MDSLPPLDDMLRNADQSRDLHPAGHVRLGYRYAIHKAFGPCHQRLSVGHQRRAMLAILMARQVPRDPTGTIYPISGIPGERNPHYLLRLAEQCMEGKSVPDDAVSHFFSMDDEVTDAFGIAASLALGVAQYDDECLDEIDLTWTEDTYPKRVYDTAFYAAVGYADDPYWISTANGRWRAFWECWLHTAILYTLRMFPD